MHLKTIWICTRKENYIITNSGCFVDGALLISSVLPGEQVCWSHCRSEAHLLISLDYINRTAESLYFFKWNIWSTNITLSFQLMGKRIEYQTNNGSFLCRTVHCFHGDRGKQQDCTWWLFVVQPQQQSPSTLFVPIRWNRLRKIELIVAYFELSHKQV